MSSKGKFRLKGSDILKTHPPAPNSIHTFLANGKTATDTEHNHPLPVTQLHKSPLAHQPNCTNTHIPQKVSDSLVRLHVQIRQDLADRLLERVFQLKRRPGHQKKAATQRAIIEAALEAYFEQPQNDRDTEP